MWKARSDAAPENLKYLIKWHPMWLNCGGIKMRKPKNMTEQAQAIITIDAEGNIFDEHGNPIGETVGIGATAPRAAVTKKAMLDIISADQFMEAIPDEAAAVAFAEDAIWQGTPRCGRCGGENVYRVKSGKPMSHRCRDCREYFSVRTGTVMAETNLPIRKWLVAIYLTLSARKGVAAMYMHKYLGVTYQTAWFLDHRIREAMRENKLPLLSGVIEVDEAYIGGKGKNLHKSKKPKGWTWKSNKFAVIGLKARDGKVIFIPVPHILAETLQDAVLDHVASGSTVYTDEAQGYKALADYGYIHEFISHGTGEYVRDMVTTNGIESMWALLKRGYIGTFHYMSWKHLSRYCDEFAFRHNAGKGNGFATIGLVLRHAVGKRLTYERLTGGKQNKSRDRKTNEPEPENK